MVLEARVKKSLLGIRRKVEVSAYCTRVMEQVEEPQIGCGQCHLEFPDFITSSEDT
jgi:hypothetical protein